MTMTIKLGDVVRWGSKKNPNALAFTGARVVELGETEDGKPAAKLDLGRYGEACALVDDLEMDQ
jgi:hypothetical protein